MQPARNLRRPLGLALLVAAAVSAMVASTLSHSAAGAPAACEVASLDGVSVDETDVRELSALLNPPPTAEQARRLALDVALAHSELRGFLAGSSARARLDAYRELLGRLRRTYTEPGAFADAASVLLGSLQRQHGATAGACHPGATPAPDGPAPVLDAAPDPAAVHARLARENERRPVLRLEQLWLPTSAGDGREEGVERMRSLHAGDVDAWATLAKGGVRHQDIGRVPPGDLAAELALAALALRPGETSAPVSTRTGVHVLRLVARWEPGTLGAADVPAERGKEVGLR